MIRKAWFLVVLFASVLLLAQAAALSLPSDASMFDREYDWSTFVFDEANDATQGFTVERAASHLSPAEQVGFAAPADGGVGHLYDLPGDSVAPNSTLDEFFEVTTTGGNRAGTDVDPVFVDTSGRSGL